MDSELERMWKWPWPNLMYDRGNYVKMFRKTIEELDRCFTRLIPVRDASVRSWGFLSVPVFIVGRDSAVGIATRYGFDGGRRILRTRPDRPWGPPSFLYNGYRVLFPGIEPSTPSSSE
jgi:hypothetical protein